MKEFPLASEVFQPIETFLINGVPYDLYANLGRPSDCHYSLYCHKETNPVQHNMTSFEVFNQLSQLLNPNHKASPYQVLPQIGGWQLVRSFLIRRSWFALYSMPVSDGNKTEFCFYLLDKRGYGQILIGKAAMTEEETFKSIAVLLKRGVPSTRRLRLPFIPLVLR